jgi:hypothetical protein
MREPHLLALALLPAALAVMAPEARGQDAPRLSIHVDAAAGHRPVLRVGPVLAEATLRDAAASGLPLRLRFRVELWRDQRPFHDLVAAEAWEALVLYDPLERLFSATGRAANEPPRVFRDFDRARTVIERAYPLPIRPPAGRFYYTAVVEIETLSLSDLEELERWLKGDLRPAVGGGGSLGGAVRQGTRRLLIRVLGLPARRFEARSERFIVP